MGAQFSSDADSQPLVTDKNGIIAAALSSAFREKVVTRQEYDRRKDEPGFGNAESLDLSCYI